MASGDRISLRVDPASEARVVASINELLKETRRQGPDIVKNLSRKAANSAAKLTIPNTGRNMPTSGSRSTVRRPSDADKYRPTVKPNEVFNGRFFVVNAEKKGGKRKNKKRRRFNGFAGQAGEKRVMRGAGGELVIYTKSRINMNDKRQNVLTPVKKLIKAWDKKKRSWHYIPTMENRKYDKRNKVGRIPFYFAAKQAWFHAVKPIARSVKFLNKAGALNRLGRMVNELHKPDQPTIRMQNNSEYSVKSGGRFVPRRALYQAYKGFYHELMKRRERIIAKAQQRG